MRHHEREPNLLRPHQRLVMRLDELWITVRARARVLSIYKVPCFDYRPRPTAAGNYGLLALRGEYTSYKEAL
jgi:hypothetical protein